MSINNYYASLAIYLKNQGEKIETRNHEVLTLFNVKEVEFKSFPLVTVRKTAWKKAIKEMAWFFSGEEGCPEELQDWWKGQLNYDNKLVSGYPIQFRRQVADLDNFSYGVNYFDQIKYILDGLKNNPNSRRLILSSWNTGEMANITKLNNNENTPTSCHSIVVQFFVRNGKLHMKTYQRSADVLLGIPHNWVQSWAMLLYFAYHSNLTPGSMIWVWGDLHLYTEESHLEVVKEMEKFLFIEEKDIDLIYKPKEVEYDWNNVPIFKTEDFSISGELPEPLITIRPKLL